MVLILQHRDSGPLALRDGYMYVRGHTIVSASPMNADAANVRRWITCTSLIMLTMLIQNDLVLRTALIHRTLTLFSSSQYHLP